MIDNTLAKHYQQCVINPLVKIFPQLLTVNPITLTAFACLIGIASGITIAFNHGYWSLLLLWASGLLDTLDGSIARITQQSSDWGACCDIIADRIVEIAVVIGLCFLMPQYAIYCVGLLASMLLCMTVFLVVGIFSHNATHKSFHYSPGLMERTETFIVFSLMILLPGLFPWLAVLFMLAVIYTAFTRFWAFKSQNQ